MNKEVLDLHLAKARLEVELKHMKVYLWVTSLVAAGVNYEKAIKFAMELLGK